MNASHPIWGIIRLAILMVAMYSILRANASNFDATEWKSIIWTFVAASSAEGVSHLFSRRDQ